MLPAAVDCAALTHTCAGAESPSLLLVTAVPLLPLLLASQPPLPNPLLLLAWLLLLLLLRLRRLLRLLAAGRSSGL